MTTAIADPITEPRTTTGAGYRRCDGCPRCQDPDAGFCKQQHPYGGLFTGSLHPICKKCGHCVLRGSHTDDISDLEVQNETDG